MKRFLLRAAAFLLGMTVTASAHARTPFFLGKSLDRWRSELTHAEAKVRRSAAFALGRIGEDARRAVPDLVARLRDDRETSVRDMAASAIGDIVKALKDGNRGMWALAGDALVNALKNDEDGHVRRSAAYALGAFGPQAGAAVDALRGALADKKAPVRQNAAWALGQIGEKAGGSVSELCKCLNDKDALVRRDAAGALGSMGKAGAAGVESLIAVVKSESDGVVRSTALDSLAHLAGPQHARFAEGLRPLLTNKDAEVSLGAAIVLARIGGDEAPHAEPVLRKALKDPDPHVQELATAALVNLGPHAEPAMHDLADMLTNAKNPLLVRRNAALAIAHIGKAAKPVVPALVQALKPSEPLEVRQYAAEALAQMRYPANEEAIPVILDTIKNDTDPLVRQKCVWALFTLGDANDPKPFLKCGADKVLAKVLDDTSEEMNLVRYDAARKLANVLRDRAPDKTADVLLHMLRNTSLNVYNRTDAQVEGAGNEATAGKVNVKPNTGGDARYMAAEALGWLGNKAKNNPDVVKALKQAAKEDDPKLKKLKQTAEEALKELGIK